MKINEKEIRFAAYSRKSTEGEDRQTLSLNDQKHDIELQVENESLNVVESFLGDEKGEKQSAHKRGRPIFGRIMKDMEDGKVNGLLVYHPNRIARNAFDGGHVITLMDEGKLLCVKTPHKTYYNTPDDKFFLQMEFGMAKKSSDDSGVVVKRGLDSKVAKGWFPNRAPLGYCNTKNFEEKGQNTIYSDPERFETVKNMWHLMLTGNYSVMQILQKARTEWNLTARPNKKGTLPKPIGRSTLYKIFTNPYYYGYFNYMGGSHKGSHVPMITEEEFWRVQALLGKKGRPRDKHKSFPFTGIMRCGNCDAAITAEEKIKTFKNGTARHYVYYRCTKRKDKNCPEKYVEAKDLNAQIDFLVSKLTISQKFQEWAIKYLHEVRTNEAHTKMDALESKKKEHQQIVEQLASLLLKFGSPKNQNGELISDSEYQSLKTSLVARKNALESDLNAQGKGIEQWIELSERTFNFARYARIWFANGSTETRRAIFSCLGSHLIIKDRKLAVQLHPVFKSLFENIEKAELEIESVLTQKDGSIQAQIANPWLVCPTLRRRRDSNSRCLAARTLSKRVH
jgi:site-specific DNA recombinase